MRFMKCFNSFLGFAIFFFKNKNKTEKTRIDTYTQMTEEMFLLTVSFWFLYYNSKQHFCPILS